MANERSTPDSAAARGIWERGGAWVAAQAVLLAAITLVPQILPGLLRWPESLVQVGRPAGLLIGGAGGLVAFLGLLSLGRNLTPLPYPKDGGELVQSGIYRVVRHPIYSGILIGSLGWSLLHGSTLALLLTFALGLLFDRKAAREEAWLEHKHPEYREYRGRVKKLIPWIY
jgi:protein-S-isoprenylcysteine O-methyltransferase Ste14